MIITLGEKRGQIFRNGEETYDEKCWDVLEKSFDDAFQCDCCSDDECCERDD